MKEKRLTLRARQVDDIHHDVEGSQGSALFTVSLYPSREVLHSLHGHILRQTVVDVELE